MRDIVQVFSLLVTVATLVIIGWKLYRGIGTLVAWFPLILISVLTGLFYVGVLIDNYVTDFMNSTEVSSIVRLSVTIALLLYAIYMPPNRRGKA